MVLLMLCLHLNSFAQHISMQLKNVTVKQAIETIQKQNGYSFTFAASDLNTQKIITVTARNLPIEKVVEQILIGQNVSYTVQGKDIIIKKKSNQATQQKKKSTISGIITDNYGEPIIGANIKEKNGTNGTISDIDGKFQLTVDEGSSVQISYLGYLTQEVNTRNKTHLAISMKEDAQALDEVVVVGYGTMKKRDLTGAISSIKMDETPVQTFTTVSHALAGKAAGLQVVQTSAQVGGGSSFNIRGAASVGAGNDPLIIIDGFPVSSSSTLGSGNRYEAGQTDNILESINPNDIESIEVLKDASSTAIYGARAGHGAIIVTTKRGKEGKASVNYSANVSVQRMKNSFKMLNGQDYMYQTNRYYHELWLKEKGEGIYEDYMIPNDDAADFKPRYSNDQILNAPTVPWFDEITRTGLMHQHNVSINGGTEKTKYMASINYLNHSGVVKNNDMERFTAKINLDQQISKYVKAGLSFNISRNNYDNVPLGNGENENSGIITAAVAFNPTVPVRDEKGNYSTNPQMPQLPNPVSLLEINDKTVKERLLGSAYIEVEPIKGLKLKANLGIDRKYQKRKTYLPKTTQYGAAVNGQAYLAQEDNNDYLMDLTANYQKIFGEHSFNVLFGYSYQKFNTEGMSAGNQDFINDSFLYNNLGAGNYSRPPVGSYASVSSLSSYFGRFNYSWKEKYLLTATIRADGASNFAKGHQWGYFPSVSAGWRFSEEKFIKSSSSDFLSNGKLRLSWGQTGNYNVGNGALDYYGADPWYGSQFGDSQHVGIYVSQLGNPNLTWETTTEFNIGLDLGFFNNRINLTAEYFQRTISDLLVKNKTIPHYNEVKTIAANIGSTQSNGVELTLNTQNIQTKQFTWSTDLTFSTYNDRWKERDPNWKPAAYQKEQDPIRGVFAYVADGLLQPGEEAPAHQPQLLPGQVKLKNINGDDKLNEEDMVLIGRNDPKFIFGFNNNFSYKNFDLNIYMYGQVGKIAGANSYYDAWGSYGNRIKLGQNVPVSFKDAWSSDNQTSTRPSFIESAYGTGDLFLQKISFLRIRNITLGYTVPISKSICNRLRVYADINNPCVWTNWKGQDPETDSNTNAYPNVTSFSIGVDISF